MVALGGHSVVVAWRAVSDFGGGGVGEVVAGGTRTVVGGGGGGNMWATGGLSFVWGRTEPIKKSLLTNYSAIIMLWKL